MKSWQAKVICTALRSVGRSVFAQAKSPDRARQRFETFARYAFSPPAGSAIVEGELGVPGLWVTNGPTSDLTIVYFHGGGYLYGSARTHQAIAGELAKRSGAQVFLPNYRLAPEHPFPAAFKDALHVWEALIARGYDPRRIVLGGESAGGGLALALLSHLCHQDQRPAGVFAYSPWTDLTLSGASLVTNAKTEQLLPPDRLTEARAGILGGSRPRMADDPRLSPLHASFPAPPPVMIHVAQTEIFRDDALRIRSRLPDAEIRVAGDLPHAWPMMHNWLPEARDTLQATAGFIQSCLARETVES